MAKVQDQTLALLTLLEVTLVHGAILSRSLSRAFLASSRTTLPLSL